MLTEFKRVTGESIKSLVAQEELIDRHDITHLRLWRYEHGDEDGAAETLALMEYLVSGDVFELDDGAGGEIPPDELTNRAMEGQVVEWVVSKDGLDSLCYRLDRCPPFSYMKNCPPDLRKVNMDHWLARQEPKQLVMHTFDGTLVSVMTTEHVPTPSHVLIGAASPRLKFKRWRWLPTESRFDMAARDDSSISIRIRNSPTGFGAIHLSSGFRPKGKKRTIRVPVQWSKPHRWASNEEMGEAFGAATEVALELALELKAAYEAIGEEPLDINWAEALATAQEFSGAKPIPTRDIKRALPTDGSPETWGALIGFFLDVANSMSAAGKDTVAEAIEYATGRLVTQLSEE